MTRVRVVTLNVWNLEGDPRRQDVINAEVRRLDPDIVSFEEVIKDGERDQLAMLLNGTPLRGTHQADLLPYTPALAGRYGGTAIASRWPYRIVETLDVREEETTGPWCTMAAVIEIPDEGEMLFIGTVLAPMFNTEPVRERQALRLTDLDRRHRRPLPTVLAGDFDAAPDNSSIRYLTGRQSLSGRGAFYFDAWDVAGDGPGFTWSIDNPNASLIMDDIIRQPGFRQRIDYVLVGEPMAHPGTYARITRAELAFDKPVDGVWPSDHFGLIVDLEVGHQDQAAR